MALGTVTEILRARTLTEIPRARPPLLGVLNLRRTITPVYDPVAAARPAEHGAALRRTGTVTRLRGGAHPGGPHRAGSGRVSGWTGCAGVQRVRPETLERPRGGPTGGVVGVLQAGGSPCTVVDPEWLLR